MEKLSHTGWAVSPSVREELALDLQLWLQTSIIITTWGARASLRAAAKNHVLEALVSYARAKLQGKPNISSFLFSEVASRR